MIPKHQQIVDDTLARMHARVNELIHHCLPASGKRPAAPTREHLRETPLGQHLTAIAHYAEGYAYPFEKDVRTSAGLVARCLYGDPLAAQGFRLPQKWQRSELGNLVHAAMLRFFEEGDKVKVTLRFRGREMAHQELGIKLLDRVKEDTSKNAKVESDARFEGRQMVMILAPR